MYNVIYYMQKAIYGSVLYTSMQKFVGCVVISAAITCSLLIKIRK